MKKQDETCKAAGKPGVTLMTYPDIASGTRLIQAGRADIMLTDLALVEALSIDNPTVYSRAYKILTGFTIGAAVKNGNKDLLNAVYDGLQVLQADGTQKKLFQKYKIDPDMQVKAALTAYSARHPRAWAGIKPILRGTLGSPADEVETRLPVVGLELSRQG